MKTHVQEVSKEKSEMKFLDSTNSDNKLPKIQQFDKNIKLEYKNLDNMISIIDNWSPFYFLLTNLKYPLIGDPTPTLTL